MVKFQLMEEREQQELEIPPFHQWICPDGELWALFYHSGNGYLLRFPGLADFKISGDGFNVVCWPLPGISEETSRHLFLNQVFPLALSMRGKLVFHASAVELRNQAIAFIAESGRGKSTLATSFARSGYALLTDDSLILEICDNGYKALPGHSSIRLWGDSEAALIPERAVKAESLSFTSKSRFLEVPDIQFCNEPRMLKHVYFLGSGSADNIIIQPLNEADALIEWVKHSFLLDIEKKSILAAHFDMVAKLASRQIHFRLDYPRCFEKLSDVINTILNHINEQ